MPGGCLILRRAFSLERLSHKMPIRAYFAFDQTLCAILECVWKRIGSHIADVEGLFLFHEYEIHAA